MHEHKSEAYLSNHVSSSITPTGLFPFMYSLQYPPARIYEHKYYIVNEKKLAMKNNPIGAGQKRKSASRAAENASQLVKIDECILGCTYEGRFSVALNSTCVHVYSWVSKIHRSFR
jgi:hypothetical protein